MKTIKMSFKAGDKVKFLNDVGGGQIRSIKGNIAEIESEDGFLIPVLISELVLDQHMSFDIKQSKNSGLKDIGDEDEENVNIFKELEDEFDIFKFKQNYQKNKAKEEPEAEIFKEKPKENLHLVLAIVPIPKGNIALDSFDLYLINDCNYKLMFNFAKIEESQHRYIQAGQLNSDSKIKLANYKFTELTRLNDFLLSFIPYKVGNYSPAQSGSYTMKLNHKKLIQEQAYTENAYFNDKAFIEVVELNEFKRHLNDLDEKTIKKAIVEKDDTPKVVKKVRIEESEITEVDLHIEQLVDDHKHLSNSEIVDIQLARFETALETAIRSKTKKIVFIHGVGNGKLKFELRQKLEKEYKKLRFQDASFKEYGYGATLVIIN